MKTKILCVGLFFFALLFFFYSKAFANKTSVKAEVFSYFKYENFFWKEIDDSRKTLLTERGYSLAPGIGMKFYFKKVFLKTDLEAFLAPSMKYNGQTMEGTPVITKNLWIGVGWDTGLGYQLDNIKSFNLVILAGLGGKNWIRRLNSTVLSNGTRVVGYTEVWQMIYFNLGLKGLFCYKKVKLWMEVRGYYPFYIVNKADLPDVSPVLLRLYGSFSPFAELGLKISKFKMVYFYMKFLFKKSNTKVVQGYSGSYYKIWQPESVFEIQGIKLTVLF